jgi:hypothetical protein
MGGEQLPLFQRKTYRGILPAIPVDIQAPAASMTVLETRIVRDERRQQANTPPSPGEIVVVTAQGESTVHERSRYAQASFPTALLCEACADNGESCHTASPGAWFPSRVRERRLILADAKTVYGGMGLGCRGPIQILGLRRVLHGRVGRRIRETAPAPCFAAFAPSRTKRWAGHERPSCQSPLPCPSSPLPYGLGTRSLLSTWRGAQPQSCVAW